MKTDTEAPRQTATTMKKTDVNDADERFARLQSGHVLMDLSDLLVCRCEIEDYAKVTIVYDNACNSEDYVKGTIVYDSA